MDASRPGWWSDTSKAPFWPYGRCDFVPGCTSNPQGPENVVTLHIFADPESSGRLCTPTNESPEDVETFFPSLPPSPRPTRCRYALQPSCMWRVCFHTFRFPCCCETLVMNESLLNHLLVSPRNCCSLFQLSCKRHVFIIESRHRCVNGLIKKMTVR